MPASMWPRAEAHGNPFQWFWQRVHTSASMWPRAEAHGNYLPVRRHYWELELQCGRGPKPTEMSTGFGR